MYNSNTTNGKINKLFWCSPHLSIFLLLSRFSNKVHKQINVYRAETKAKKKVYMQPQLKIESYYVLLL